MALPARLEIANQTRPPREVDHVERAAALDTLLASYPDDLHNGVRWLVERFPIAFSPEAERIRPLKVGIHKDILAIAFDEAAWLTPEILRDIMRIWAQAPAYRGALLRKKRRRDLDGQRCAFVKMSELLHASKGAVRSRPMSKQAAAAAADELLARARGSDGGRAQRHGVIEELHKVLDSLAHDHPAREELGLEWLRLSEAGRKVKRTRHDATFATAYKVLSPDQCAHIESVARGKSEGFASPELLDRYDAVAREIDLVNLSRLGPDCSDEQRNAAGLEMSRLQDQLSPISKELKAKPLREQAFSNAALDVLGGDEYRRLFGG